MVKGLKVTANIQSSISICPDHTFWSAELFVIKLGMGSCHPKLEHHKNKLVCYIHSRRAHGGKKYGCFCYIFWMSDPFATKLCFMVHHHKFECLVNRLLCCVQDQGHSKDSKLHSVFVKTVSSKPFNLLSAPKLSMVSIIMSQGVLRKDCFAIIKVKVTMMAHLVKVWSCQLCLQSCGSKLCNWTYFDGASS